MDPLKDAQAYFGDKAQAYRQSASHANRADLERMISWVRPAAGSRALDVATGGGHTALALRDAGCDALATDATRAMLVGLDLPGALADAQRLPFRAGSFDVVASRIAPHHFADLDAFAREAARVLRPGGSLYVFDLTTPEDPAMAATIDRVERLRDPSHVRSWPPSRWRDAISKSGLRLERLDETSSEMDLEAWIARARMPLPREAELRGILAGRPELGGYGATPAGRMRVLRVELLARKPGA